MNIWEYIYVEFYKVCRRVVGKRLVKNILRCYLQNL